MKELLGIQVDPQYGGCWFCNRIGPEEMEFSTEFDAYFHMRCLEDRIDDPEDREAHIIGREYGVFEQGAR